MLGFGGDRGRGGGANEAAAGDCYIRVLERDSGVEKTPQDRALSSRRRGWGGSERMGWGEGGGGGGGAVRV